MTFVEYLGGGVILSLVQGGQSLILMKGRWVFLIVSKGESNTNYGVYRECFNNHGVNKYINIKYYLGRMIVVKLCPAGD